MKCAYCKENMWAYLEGDLSKEMQQEMEQHLQVCPDCREEMEQMQNMLQALHSLPDVALPEGYHTELMQKIEQEANTNNVVQFLKAKTKNWKNFGLVAAALLVVAAAGGVQGIQRMRQPHDAIVAEVNEPMPVQTEEVSTKEMEQQEQQPESLIAEPFAQESETKEVLQQQKEVAQPKQQITNTQAVAPQNQATSTKNTTTQKPKQAVMQSQPFADTQAPQAASVEPIESGQGIKHEPLMANRSAVQQPETEYATLSVKDQKKAVEDVKKAAENLSLEVTTTDNQVTISMQYQQKADFYKALEDMGTLTIDTKISENTKEDAKVLVQITCEQQL